MSCEIVAGDKFERLTVLEFAGIKHGHKTWKCLCDCGNIKVVRAGHLGTVIYSCGCYQKDSMTKRMTKHGYSRDGNYYSYNNMVQRCYNMNVDSYPRYGGRGIKICDRWLEVSPQGFLNFLEDMGEKPSKKHSIDRINNDGDYTPENCRWATQLEQSNNKSNNAFITFNGKTHTVTDWGRITGFGAVAIVNRLLKKWSVEKALTTPVRPKKRNS